MRQAPDPHERFTVEPDPPLWVDRGSAPADPGSTSEPVHMVLLDLQVDADSASVYRRFVQRMNNPQGVQTASQVEVGFDPATQRLAIHSIGVIRAGERREAATGAGAFRMLQRESNLEKQIYDGTISAVLLIEDVRVGDMIDVSYTVVHEDPTFPGRFTSTLPIASPVPLDQFSLTVRAGEAFNVAATDGSTLEQESEGDTTVWRKRAEGAPPLELDPGAPLRLLQFPHLQTSNFASWAEVSSMAAMRWDEMIHGQGDDPPEMQEFVSKTTALGEPAARVDAAVRFVQSEVRYLGLEDGISSFIPESPARVFTRRFGDCKDKTLLLCHLLDRLGVRAWPVLVNDSLGSGVRSLIPAPSAFNHVIAAYEVDGDTHYVDVTISGQGGATGTRVLPSYEVGLPIFREGAELVDLPPPSADDGELHIEEVFAITKKGDPAVLSVTTTARGSEADAIRHMIGAGGGSGAEKAIEETYREVYPGAVRDGEMEHEDDLAANVLVVRQRFTIPDLAQRTQAGSKAYIVFAHLIGSRIAGCPDDERELPLGLPFPNRLRQTIRFRPPSKVPINPEKAKIAGPGFEFRFEAKAASQGEITLDYHYSNSAPEVAPSDYKEYMKQLEQVAGSIGYGIPVKGGVGSGAIATAIGFVMVFCLMGLVRSCEDRGRSERSRGRPPAVDYERSDRGWNPGPTSPSAPGALPGGVRPEVPRPNIPSAPRPNVPTPGSFRPNNPF